MYNFFCLSIHYFVAHAIFVTIFALFEMRLLSFECSKQKAFVSPELDERHFAFV